MNNEIWTSIKDFSNYFVSNIGNVESKKQSCRKRLKPFKIPKGYLIVRLRKDGKQYTKLIHRLVLEAFVGPCPDGHETNHKDGNKQNNQLENLEWVTSSDNYAHAYRTGLQRPHLGELHPNSKLKNDEVWLIKRLLWFEYPQNKIAKMFRVISATINHIKTGKNWSHIKFEPTKRDVLLHRDLFIMGKIRNKVQYNETN